MSEISRRGFIAQTGLAIAGSAFTMSAGASLRAWPLDGLMGLQGADVRAQLAADYEGTLRQLAGFGYKAIDLVPGNPTAATYRPGKDIRRMLDAAGMVAHNAHFPFVALTEGYDKTISEARDLGLKEIVCQAAQGAQQSADALKKFAEDLTRIGGRLKADGIQAGYHNHSWEFRAVDGQIPFDILLANTDPAVVKFQIDVGNCMLGGGDPIAYLSKYPNRYYSMHVRDVRDGKSGIAVGEGTMDFKRIFTLAKAAGIHNYDVETGAPSDVVMEKLRASAAYLRTLTI